MHTYMHMRREGRESNKSALTLSFQADRWGQALLGSLRSHRRWSPSHEGASWYICTHKYTCVHVHTCIILCHQWSSDSIESIQILTTGQLMQEQLNGHHFCWETHRAGQLHISIDIMHHALMESIQTPNSFKWCVVNTAVPEQETTMYLCHTHTHKHGTQYEIGFLR